MKISEKLLKIGKNNKQWDDIAVLSPKKGKNSWTYDSLL